MECPQNQQVVSGFRRLLPIFPLKMTLLACTVLTRFGIYQFGCRNQSQFHLAAECAATCCRTLGICDVDASIAAAFLCSWLGFRAPSTTRKTEAFALLAIPSISCIRLTCFVGKNEVLVPDDKLKKYMWPYSVVGLSAFTLAFCFGGADLAFVVFERGLRKYLVLETCWTVCWVNV